jgi:hypothetical protein
MKRFLVSVRPFLASATLILAVNIVVGLVQSVAAAEPPSKNRTDAAPANRDGSLFTAFVSVLRHPRCMNCHSTGDFPRQGDYGYPHAMEVGRGAEGQALPRKNAAPVSRTTIWTVPIFLPARPIGGCLRPTFQ